MSNRPDESSANQPRFSREPIPTLTSVQTLTSNDRESLYDAAMTAAAGITDRIAANADRSEEARRLDDDSVAALREANLFRLLTPSRYGGLEAGMRAQCDTAGVIAQAHPSAAWVQLVMASHAWITAGFPTECQDEVFADSPDVMIPGAQAPQGRATKVPGGWRLTGQWQFCSGVDHGSWVLVGAAARPLMHFVLPIADVAVVDTWYTLGMRATGSKDIRIDDVFVPEHRSIETRVVFDGQSPYGAQHPSGLYQIPIHPGLTLQLAHVIWGMAARGLELFIERNGQRVETYTKNSKAEMPGIQMRVAETALEVQTARMLLGRASAEWDEIAATHTVPSLEDRARLKWDASYAVELCRRGLARIFDASGAHAIYDDSPLQLLYRDMNTACHHAAADFDTSAQMFGRTRLGLDPGSVLL
jgi:3-hydroxy-9,10-secoandrosta-1,3,5(10)-triene-9,17-dione monooxygenase